MRSFNKLFAFSSNNEGDLIFSEQLKRDLYNKASSDRATFYFIQLIKQLNDKYFSFHRKPLGLTIGDFSVYHRSNNGFQDQSKNPENSLQHNPNTIKVHLFFKVFPTTRKLLTQYPKIIDGALSTMETVIVIAGKPKGSQASPSSKAKKRASKTNKEKGEKSAQAAKEG